jgi:hypothetical protein
MAKSVTCAALVLLCMTLVLWVRLVPRSLPATGDWAERIARRHLQSQPETRTALLADRWIDQHRTEFAAMTTAISVSGLR